MTTLVNLAPNLERYTSQASTSWLAQESRQPQSRGPWTWTNLEGSSNHN